MTEQMMVLTVALALVLLGALLLILRKPKGLLNRFGPPIIGLPVVLWCLPPLIAWTAKQQLVCSVPWCAISLA